MNKRNSINSNYQHCSICLRADDEVIFIVDSLFEQICKIFKALKKENTETQTSKLQPLDFSRLIKMVFTKKFKNSKATTSCKHYQLKKEFASKLKCSEKQLDRVSSALSWKLAKFQYHTDVIISQSKSFIRHFIPEQGQKQVEVENSQKKQSSNVFNEIKQENQQNQPIQMVFNNLIVVPQTNQFPQGFYHPYSCMWQYSWPPHIIMANSEIQLQQMISKNFTSNEVEPKLSQKSKKKF